ncbi:MAG: T9SS type B sorting domain-containing protein [Winogradskyella sp.]|uniref:T9SS type B sorting domain-containing protein n=1 Tax=Winogradskyella sp. TaxID=1883156 RepID=UPI001814A8C1|nr:T9SS type B sorting domain-containing protein [Winogradskyella sp.]
MKKESIYAFLLFTLHVCCSYAQQVITESSTQPQQLLQELVGDNCVTVSNVSSPVNGAVNNINSFGTFQQANSNFPLQNGIILSTGSITTAGNSIIGQDLSYGDVNWETDSDIFDIVGIDQTLNATSIAFDFVSANDFVAFKYIFASEEYQQAYPCNFSDVFAILIKPAGSMDPYTNMALVPETNSLVSTNTIRPNIEGFCSAQNEDYFQGYNGSNTNFNGLTKVFTSQTNIIPGETYHIKFVIADHIDERFDSAVFIETQDFGGSIDLGPDQSVCGTDLILNAAINNNSAIYNWFLNGSLINGENSPTLQVLQSGTYSVEISIPTAAGNCNFGDTIEIEIVPFQNAARITDIEVCDPAPSDRLYDFNFSALKDAEILAELPSTNYNITYHLTQDDALNNINSLSEVYQNSEDSETIFVRIESINGDCLQLGTFNFQIYDSPPSAEITVNICDGRLSDFTFVNINILDPLVSEYNNSSDVSYYLSEADAINKTNELTEYPDFTGFPEFMHARIESIATGCFSLERVYFNYLTSPDLGIEKFTIDGCVRPDYYLNQGSNTYTYENAPITFNIEEAILELQEVYPSATVRVLVPIFGNPRLYTITSAMESLPIGVSFEESYCETTISLEFHKNLLYNVLEEQRISTGCDDASNDGVFDFNLNDVHTELQSGYNMDITFYESEEDRANNQNPLDRNQPFTVTDYEQTLFINSTSYNCEYDSEVKLVVNSKPSFPPKETSSCGSYNAIDNTSQISINPLKYVVNEGLSNFEVAFYLTESDAINQQNEVVDSYDVPGDIQLFYTRITNTNTGCFQISSLLVNISDTLDENLLEPIIICDADQDGMATLNLETVIPIISEELSNFNYTFFSSYENALSNIGAISNPQNYSTETTEIFVKIKSGNNCIFILGFDVLIYNDPQLVPIRDYTQCQEDFTQSANFIFETKDAEIINSQDHLNVRYFETENEAYNNLNPIDKTIDYQNASNPQTIYYRLQNNDENSCFKVGSFLIEVREYAIFNAPTDMFACDDNSNGMVTVDLSEKISEITTASPQNLAVSFHLTPFNANNGINNLPLTFTTSIAQQLVYARILNVDSGCFEVVSFYINALALPTINLEQSLIACGNNFNYEQTWDLTEIELLLLNGRQFGITFSYYESESDLFANINEILTPESYTNSSSPQTLYAKVTNTTTGCFISVAFNLVLNTPPPIHDFEVYNVCANDENSTNLDAINAILLENTFNVLVSYYNSEADAASGQNVLNTNYTYTTTSQMLYARVEYSTTKCYAVYPFQLVINSPPLANPLNNIIACDDDFDGVLEVALMQQDDSIIGNQNINEHAVSYYNSIDNAIESINDIDKNSYLASHNEVIYARIENNTTGCFSTTQFSVIINALPTLSIDDQVICLDNLPLIVNASTGNSGDSYLWSTNATTPQIEILETGTYTVTVTNSSGCVFTESFAVTESESATIDVVETIDFSDPNNITITVSGIGNYSYQLNNLTVQTSNIFNNVPIGYNTVTIRDLNGCAQITHVVLVIDAPKHLTPNNDGDFDTWHIAGIETLPGSKVYIYDRFGKLLKELNSNSLGWDGTYNGNKMPAGNYWYSATIYRNNQSFQVTGHFALRR